MTEGAAVSVIERACAVVIGDELLSGKVSDQNVMPLARALRGLGIRLCGVSMIPDQVPLIAAEIIRVLPEADVVFTSGGVGPTHDDVSVEGVARALGVGVVEDAELVQMLAGFYGERFTPLHRRMARVPAGSRLVRTRDVRWPAIVCQKVWMLPGVPELFRAKVGGLREHFRGPRPIHGSEVLSRAEEADLIPAIDDVVANFPDVEVGSYPKWFDPTYRTRITLDGPDRDRVEAAASALRQAIADSVVERGPS